MYVEARWKHQRKLLRTSWYLEQCVRYVLHFSLKIYLHIQIDKLVYHHVCAYLLNAHRPASISGPSCGSKPWLEVLQLMGYLLSSYRIVCEMGEAKPSQHAGFVEICVAVCRPEFMARSSQLYYFMVSPGCQRPCWVQATTSHTAIIAEQSLHPTTYIHGSPM